MSDHVFFKSKLFFWEIFLLNKFCIKNWCLRMMNIKMPKSAEYLFMSTGSNKKKSKL